MTRETISRMIERSAKILRRCDVAQGHYGNVDLKRIVKAKGGDYSVVNRRPRCRMSGCPGVVIFEDFARSWARQVETIQRASPEWWAENDRRRSQLQALGYRIEMGKRGIVGNIERSGAIWRATAPTAALFLALVLAAPRTCPPAPPVATCRPTSTRWTSWTPSAWRAAASCP
ncbi:hypothetical protein [Brevundimonas naejangsanensis]|uniref:hypothetical protein n=1 Tax=Brevundimonas naejangsanensis TaxID=588932 RepID=UPI0032099513